jgi:hypothetical protein
MYTFWPKNGLGYIFGDFSTNSSGRLDSDAAVWSSILALAASLTSSEQFPNWTSLQVSRIFKRTFLRKVYPKIVVHMDMQDQFQELKQVVCNDINQALIWINII